MFTSSVYNGWDLEFESIILLLGDSYNIQGNVRKRKVKTRITEICKL